MIEEINISNVVSLIVTAHVTFIHVVPFSSQTKCKSMIERQKSKNESTDMTSQ